MKALVIVDMLEDFVHGALANPRALEIVPPLRRLLDHARSAGWVVVFSNDAHRSGDRELAIWGEHAMEGTPGAAVIAELAPAPGPDELLAPKRWYGAFEGTSLHRELSRRGVDEVVLAGQHTNICVRHSAYGAFVAGYRITVARDAVCALRAEDEEPALEYLRAIYGARIATVEELVAGRDAVGAAPA